MTTTTSIVSRYHFEAAHFLPNVPEGHKCRSMHGHNYKVEVEVRMDGIPAKSGDGFVMDFADLDKVMEPIIKELDHGGSRTFLDTPINFIPGLENPTAELIADWIMRRLVQSHIDAWRVTVFETDQYSATILAE